MSLRRGCARRDSDEIARDARGSDEELVSRRLKYRKGELVWVEHGTAHAGPAIVLNGWWNSRALEEAQYEVFHAGEVWPKIYDFEICKWKEGFR